MSVTADKRIKSSPDVFMKTRDLLDYTLRITSNPKVFRPDIDKQVKDIKEITKTSKDADQIIAALSCTVDNLSDPVENIYVWLISKLRDSANQIFINSWKANNIRVGKSKEYKEMRLEYQKNALLACAELKAYISLAKRLCHLKSKRIIYWNGKVTAIQKELALWHNKDKERYKGVK